jgi:hypothetical protein
MLRSTAFPFFCSVFNPFDSFAQASIISTRSRTVQKLFVTPAAIAGVHRIAILDFTNPTVLFFVLNGLRHELL